MKYRKEEAKTNFIKMIKSSWSYDKLTEEEKNRLLDLINSKRTEYCLKGTYFQRWQILQAIYYSFLMALDYKPIGWREKEKTTKF